MSFVYAVFLVMSSECRLLSLFLFMGNVLPPRVRKAFHCLRDAAVHYMGAWKMGVFSFQECERRAKQGHEKVMEYGKLAQELFGDGICTYNLHTLACRGYKQETSRGPAWRETEFWVERLIQDLKQRIKYRAKAMAEVVLVNDLLDSMAITRMKSLDPRNTLKTIDEFLPRIASKAIPNSTYHEDSGILQVHLRGANEVLPKKDAGPLRRQMAEHWKAFHDGDESGWDDEDMRHAAVVKCTHCTLTRGARETQIQSESYNRRQDTLSHYVHLTYDYQDDVCQHVAKIKMFVRMLPPEFSDVTNELHLAVADMYDARFMTDGGRNALPMLQVDDLRNPVHRNYPVKVQDMKEALIVCLPDNSNKGYFVADEVDEGL